MGIGVRIEFIASDSKSVAKIKKVLSLAIIADRREAKQLIAIDSESCRQMQALA